MRYSNGQEVIVGDLVCLGGCSGIVVCSIDRNEYSKTQPKNKWDYLKQGVVIEFERYGLIHYQEPESDLKLVARKA